MVLCDIFLFYQHIMCGFITVLMCMSLSLSVYSLPAHLCLYFGDEVDNDDVMMIQVPLQ